MHLLESDDLLGSTGRRLCLNGFPAIAVDPATSRVRDKFWRNACWMTSSNVRRLKVEGIHSGDDIWLACGRSIAAVICATQIIDLAKARFGATPLISRSADTLTLVYAVSEPVVSGRSDAFTVLGLGSRIEAFATSGTKPIWLYGTPLDFDVQALPVLSNEMVIDCVRTASGNDSEGKDITLKVDRDYLVEELSSPARLAQLALTRLLRGKKLSRRALQSLGVDAPDEACGMYIAETRSRVIEPKSRDRIKGRTTPFAEMARKAAANGYSVVAVRPVTKDPIVKPDWRGRSLTRASANELENWANLYGNAGFGLATGKFITAIDIDANEPARVEAIAAIARAVLGNTPLVRTGRPPRVAMVYRCQEPIVTMRWRDLEVLGLGTHMVAFGTHPRTKKPYRWMPSGDPTTIPLEQIPAVSISSVEHFIASVGAHFGERPTATFGLDERNVIPIITSSLSMSRLLMTSLKSKSQRREAVRDLLDGKFAGTGSGLAVEWRDDG